MKDAHCAETNEKLALSQVRICRPPPPLRNGHIYMKDAHCAETNEKSALSQVGIFPHMFLPLLYLWKFITWKLRRIHRKIRWRRCHLVFFKSRGLTSNICITFFIYFIYLYIYKYMYIFIYFFQYYLFLFIILNKHNIHNIRMFQKVNSISIR